MAKVFIDSNILVYTADGHEKSKQKKARAVIKDAQAHETPVLSTQVLQEFYSALTSKLKIDKLAAKALLHNFTKMETVQINIDIIEQAVDISILAQISFWDALIIASAEYAKCALILSEDLNDGQIIRGVRIVNPLKR
ncbi:MAG: PIN domain-containing protein [Spirochaetales bacterium]|nr:PIN domain-containing protein [Spirochaetales bacterium]